MRQSYRGLLAATLTLSCGFLGPAPAHAAVDADEIIKSVGAERPPCCSKDLPGLVWVGGRDSMTFQELASYCAPILWFSPDEPLLLENEGKTIDIPMEFPFDTPTGNPVTHYRVRKLLTSGDDSIPATIEGSSRANTVIDFKRVSAVELDYFFYYPSEEGLGGHTHDVESAEMKVWIVDFGYCKNQCEYGIFVWNVTGKAHGVLWYDNTLNVDKYTKFPMTILVEEGKHASCTDKNSDGYYTPGYDVNKRVNDAWGVRDVIRGGGLFAGGFEAWFAKVRRPEHRVMPPLPQDSPLREDFTVDGEYSPENAVYELRPFPRPNKAAYDPHLLPFIEDKGHHDWPEIGAYGTLSDLGNWLDEEAFLKSVSVSFRADGDLGVSVVFPLLIFKHVQDPAGGGWLVNRIYFKDKRLKDFGYTVLYTTSASRWIDGYFSLGYEWNEGELDDWVTESGLKFRANIGHSKLSFLKKLGTDFWGLRAGLKSSGLMKFREMGYVIEFGAGSF